MDEGCEAMGFPDDRPFKEYVGYIWIGDKPGLRLSIMARSSTEAMELVEAEFGAGHPYSIHNEEDASRPR